MLPNFRKIFTAMIVAFALIGGVWGAIAALNATFATKAHADSLLTKINANTKRLEIKIIEDKIYYVNRTKWAFILKFGKECKECLIFDENIAKLKRELARQ